MSVSMFDKYKIDEPQSTFITSKAYTVGENALYVFLNGMLCVANEHYAEINPFTIKFYEDLEPGDILIISSSSIDSFIESNFKSIKLIGNGEDAIFKRYDGSQHLMYNQLYKLDLTIGGKNYNYSFTSRYSPLYSTTKIIRTDLQDIIDGIDDDVINFTIWQNSILSKELATDEIDDNAVPFYTKQWVRYKTELDLLNTIYLAMSGKIGTVSKKLGSLSIEKTFKIPYLEDLLKEIKEKLKTFEKQANGVKTGAKATRKAGKSSYPVIDRRSF